ncbi:penicillin-binding protein 1A [Chromatium okenii]|uniref:penicillin-binding protein 1A n=1 Tax=Chromatium okenii TaxID=61644 RepID=UPI0034E9676D
MQFLLKPTNVISTESPKSIVTATPPDSLWQRIWRIPAQLLVTLLGVALQILLLGSLGAAIFVEATLPDLPNVQQLHTVVLQQPLQVLSADGALIAEFGIERRQAVPLQDIPQMVVQAFLATEDNRFFEHRGIDLIGIGRALLSYLKTGEKTQGGSTITMQVARNFFLSSEKTFQRKLIEVLLTLHIEQTLTKPEILELYLNQIFFGHRTYGIVAAASLYYDQPLTALSVAEIAMLAGIPKAPSANNPLTNPVRALERRNYILGRMYELGYLNTAQYEQARAAPNTAQLHYHNIELDAGYVAEMARAEVQNFYGEAAVTQGYRVTTTLDSKLQNAAQDAVRSALRQYDRRHGYRGPEATLPTNILTETQLDDYLATVVEIPTLTPGVVMSSSASETVVYLGDGQRVTLKPRQLAWARSQRDVAHWRGPRRNAAASVQVGDLIRLRRTAQNEWEISQIPRVGGALVVVSPRDGAVRALVSGYSFNDTKFNRAVDMRRQPGSSFKPFVYATALAKGWKPDSVIHDQTVALPAALNWNPQNSDHRQLGAIPLRKALALSRNLASINLLQRIGINTTRAYIRRFGFTDEALPAGLSMVLGSGALSPVKLAEGYAVFANGGYHVIPYFIQRIEDGDGRVLFTAQPPQACADCWYQRSDTPTPSPPETAPAPNPTAERVLDPHVAYRMTEMLRGVIEHGTGFRAKKLKRSDIVGKTGTTNEVRDSWFAGYQANWVAVAWMGFDDFGKLGWGEEGGKAALGLWSDFMRVALVNQPVATLKMPSGELVVDTTTAPDSDLPPPEAEPVTASVPVRTAPTVRRTPVVTRAAKPPVKPKPTPQPKPKAPRVMDELF